MLRLELTDEDVYQDVVQTCKKYESVLPDSVGYKVFEYYSIETSEPIPFVSLYYDGMLDHDLAGFLDECGDKPSHIDTETRAGTGEPVIYCENVGDCAAGFEWLLENYPLWHKYKIQSREEKRLDQRLKKEPPEAL